MSVNAVKNKKTRSNKRSRRTSIIALLLALIMLLTGTFAWQSISQQALNQTIGVPAPAGGRLHNDRELIGERHGTREWEAGMTANHDIYIENFENDLDMVIAEGLDPALVGRDVFVRVRLYEYMEIGTGANLLPGEYGYDSRLAADNGRVQPLVRYAPDGETLTCRDDHTTWTPFIPGSEDTEAFRQYWEFNHGGWKYYMPTFNRDALSSESDVKGDSWDPIGANTPDELPNFTLRNIDHPLESDSAYNPDWVYSADAGLHDFFAPAGTTHEAPRKFMNELPTGATAHATTFPTAWTHTSRPTANATEILSMDEWWDLFVAEGVYHRPAWVFDEDGWMYWSQPINPQTATGLLLDQIQLIERPQEEWFYDIHVNAQIVTAEGWLRNAPGGGWLANPPRGLRTGMTRRARRFMVRVSNPDLANPAEMLEVGETFEDVFGWDWQVIGIDGDGNRLIITEDVHEVGTRYNTAQGYSRLTNSTALAPVLEEWFYYELAPDLLIHGLTAENIDNDVRSAASDFMEGEMTMPGMTRAGGEMSLVSPASDVLFVLSLSEVNRYFETAQSRIARISNEDTTITTPGNWWLRSPGSAASTPTTRVTTTGARQAVTAVDTNTGFRPAMWVPGVTLAAGALENPAATLDLGETFEDLWGEQWQVIGQDTDGNRLAIMQRVVGVGVRYNIANNHTFLETSTSLGSALEAWYTFNLSPDIRNFALPTQNINTDVRTTVTDFTPGELGLPGMTSPAEIVSASVAARDKLFTLSLSEVNRYFYSDTQRQASCIDGTLRNWWTRSPGGAGATPATRVTTTGSRVQISAQDLVAGFRPAVWLPGQRVPVATLTNPAETADVGEVVEDMQGTRWRVLTMDENGNRLVITENVFGVGVRFRNTTGYVNLANSALRPALDAWWEFNLSPDMRHFALPANVNTDVRTSASSFSASEFGANGVALPTLGTSTPQNSLFVLSVSEVMQFFDTDAQRRATCIDGTFRNWWTRSPGNTTASSGSRVLGNNGTRAHIAATNQEQGFRPAMWLPGRPAQVGDVFIDDGATGRHTWRILDEDNDGNRLIIANRVRQSSRYHYTTSISWSTCWHTFWVTCGPCGGAGGLWSGGTPNVWINCTTCDTAGQWQHTCGGSGGTSNGSVWVNCPGCGGAGGWNTTTFHARAFARLPNTLRNSALGGLRLSLNNWWTNTNLSSQLRERALFAGGMLNDVRPLGTTLSVANMPTEQGSAGFSYVSTGAVAANGSNATFVLSLSEVNRFFPTPESRVAFTLGSSANTWSTRSQGAGANTYATISTAGAFVSDNTQNSRGFRPAMWIRPAQPSGNVGTSFRCSNAIAWHVLHIDEDGNRLLVTDNVFSSASATASGSGIRWHNANPATSSTVRLNDAEIRGTLNTWFTNNVASTEIGSRALVAENRNNDVRGNSGVEARAENESAGRTYPGVPTTSPEEAMFVLSISENNHYFGNTGTGANPARVAACVAGTVRNHWTRSPGATTATAAANRHSIVNTSGTIANSDATTAQWFRPAIWIGPMDFN